MRMTTRLILTIPALLLAACAALQPVDLKPEYTPPPAEALCGMP
jgi:hypothetical protein